MTKSFSNKIILYLFLLLGLIFIIWSFAIIINNYKNQKQFIIQNSVNQINKSDDIFNNLLHSKNKFIINTLETISKESDINENLTSGKDKITAKSLEDFLRNHHSIAKLEVYNKNGKKLYDHRYKAYDSATYSFDKLQYYDLQTTIKTGKISDSLIYYPESTNAFLSVSYPIINNNTITGYLHILYNISYIIKFYQNLEQKKELSFALYKIKNGKFIIHKYNPTHRNQDSLIFLKLPAMLGSEPIVEKFDNCFKIYKKTKISFFNDNYFLFKIITPVTLWAQFQNLFKNFIFSIVLIVTGISFLFLVIFYSYKKYNQYSKSNKILEEKIKNENRFKDLFENAFMASCIIQNNKIVIINKAGMDLIEVESLSELKQFDILDFIHPDDKAELKEKIQNFNPTKDNFKRRQRKIITAKGKVLIVELAGYQTEFNDKPAVHVMVNDITERQEFIKKLIESELKYRSIFEKLNDAVLLIKDNLFVDCNDAAISIYGFESKAELLGTHPGKLSPEKQPDNINSLEKSNKMIQKAFDEGFNRFEWLHKRKDGTLFWMDVSLTSIIMNGQKYIYVIGRDITEEKKIYSELKESKNYLFNIIKNIPIPVIVYADNQNVTFINNSFVDTIKYNINDIPDSDTWWKRTIKDPHMRAELRKNWDKAIAKIGKNNNVVEQQWDIITKDGSKKTCVFFAIRLKDEYLVVINDITEVVNLNHELLKAKEKAQESNKLKSAFLANLSHELRTPMNGILGFSQLLAAGDLDDDERANYVKIIQQSGNRLLNMINDIINISKIDANQIEIYTYKVPLLPILSEIIEFYKLLAREKNIDFSFYPTGLDENIMVNTDEGKLKQILSNIIGNAVKYTSEGEIIVASNVLKNFIEIKVTDTGYGIKPEKYEQIFERFVRLEETSNKTDGTGLGLSISKAYAKRLGIDISVESEFGKGSVFTITIPFDINSNIPVKKKEEKTKISEDIIPDLTGKTIIVAEDDDLNYMILKLHIENTNADIIRAHNGKEAVDIVNNQHVDFIFMDIKMPIMDGKEAMHIIKSLHPDIPVVAQTAFTFSEDKDKALEKGFNDYISKPLSKKDVIDVLRKFLG